MDPFFYKQRHNCSRLLPRTAPQVQYVSGSGNTYGGTTLLDMCTNNGDNTPINPLSFGNTKPILLIFLSLLLELFLLFPMLLLVLLVPLLCLLLRLLFRVMSLRKSFK
ncbi:hypothetical protein J1N35_023088, partial [Gossypium stocksii]